jgi:hypothetical protein
MSHYANLATLGFRVLAIFALCYSGAWVAIALCTAVVTGPGALLMVVPFVVLLPLGIALYRTAPRLGRLAARGIGDD